MDTDTERISVESRLKELHAYAKLLFLRSGRQFEGKVSYQELEEETSPDECSNDGSSSNNAPLGNFDTDQLRRNFLDRLSETISSMKGGRHVTASYMFYWPDRVRVFVAMNSGLVGGDASSKFLDTLCTSLKAISVASDNETEKHMDALWNILLRHQSSRLQATIVDLRQIMKSFNHLLPQHPSSKSIGNGVLTDIDGIMLDFEGCLKVLAQLLFGDSDSDLERHNNLVTVSHAVYRTFPAERFQALGRQGEKLRQEIGFLGRLQTSLHVLVAAARQISGFDDLSLIPVVKPKIRKKPSGQEWSLPRTFHALNIQLSDTSVEKLMQPSSSKIKWTKNKVITDFSRLKTPKWEVHAEVQLIAFTLSHPDEIANGKRFDYIGCSRYICLQCSKFLQCFPGLKTRGCHGKLYNHSWTLPPGDSLGKGEQQALYAAASEVASWMRKELLGSPTVSHHRKSEVKESTIGGSLMSMLETSQEGHQQSHAMSEHLYRQRAEAFHGKSSHNRNLPSLPNSLQDERTSIVEAHDTTAAESFRPSCTTCFEKTTRRCSYCRQGPFCNNRCERRMPLSHLLKCNMRQVTSADYLYQDVIEDIIPTDSQVRQEYWFDRCQSSHEESHLLGLFAGLLRYHHDPITREELHWWRSDSGANEYLVKRIVEKFEELPKSGTGGYFPWFLRHRNRFELPDGHGSIPPRPSPEMQVEMMRDKARKYLAPEDQNKDFEDLSPFSKMHCFAFYSLTIASAYPPPMNRDACYWFDFGFVVCQNQHEEESLGRMYNSMLFGSLVQLEYEESLRSPTLEKYRERRDPACTFEEFWKAWERGDLMAIFSRCWPVFTTKKFFQVAEYDLLGRLRIFMETEAPRPSVWKLRHFLAIKDISVESAVPELAQAAQDYGFSKALDTRTTIELKEFYMQLFEKAEPMEIHSGRMKGVLLQFAERHVDSMPLRVKKVIQSL